MAVTIEQQKAIDEYLKFKELYPQLFAPRISRRIITDRTRLEAYAAENDVVLGIAAQTPYVYFLLDLVEVTDAAGHSVEFPYFRLVYRKQLDGAINAVIVGIIANPMLGPVGAIVMLRQERHATGQIHLELPRGFGETHLSGEENALQELREETGFTGETASLLGRTYTDTGAMDALVSFYRVEITGREPTASTAEEAIHEVQLLSLDAILARIQEGEISDSFTLQALALLQRTAEQSPDHEVIQIQATPA